MLGSLTRTPIQVFMKLTGQHFFFRLSKCPIGEIPAEFFQWGMSSIFECGPMDRDRALGMIA